MHVRIHACTRAQTHIIFSCESYIIFLFLALNHGLFYVTGHFVDSLGDIKYQAPSAARPVYCHNLYKLEIRLNPLNNQENH